ncbi:hypothetical protein KKF05_04335 [Patescibacteria group bacterium]|nr:hypothetical protein [Patescibacteria group bacterium]
MGDVIKFPGAFRSEQKNESEKSDENKGGEESPDSDDRIASISSEKRRGTKTEKEISHSARGSKAGLGNLLRLAGKMGLDTADHEEMLKGLDIDIDILKRVSEMRAFLKNMPGRGSEFKRGRNRALRKPEVEKESTDALVEIIDESTQQDWAAHPSYYEVVADVLEERGYFS